MYWLTVMELPIGGKAMPGTQLADAHKTFAWLPDDPFMFLTKVTCQRYIADHLPKLNTALFNCDENSERLKLWQSVTALDGAGCGKIISRKFQRERTAMKRTDKADKHTKQVYDLTVDAMRRGNGSAWNVCK